jgi:hypothetical protein
MTREIVSEADVEYDFQCFCGTPIVTTEKTGTCTNCGRTFRIRRVGKRTHWRVNTAQPIGVRDVLELVVGRSCSSPFCFCCCTGCTS